MQGMLHPSVKLLDYAILRFLLHLLASRCNLCDQKPFLLFMAGLHFAEEKDCESNALNWLKG